MSSTSATSPDPLSRVLNAKGAPPPSQSLANTFIALDHSSPSPSDHHQPTSLLASGSPPSKSLLAMMPMDPRFGKEHAGLLRLFKSDFFNEWMAVYYLFKYADHDGIQHYLCDQLRYKFPASAVLEFLPQLCHILVVNPGMTHLESLLVNRCRASTHFALLTLWYFESYLSDLANVPDSLAHMMCSRVMATVEAIIHAAPDDDTHTDPGTATSLPPDTPLAERLAADPFSGDLSSLSPKAASLPRPSSLISSTASPSVPSSQPNSTTAAANISIPRSGSSSVAAKRASGGSGRGSRSNSPRNSISLGGGGAGPTVGSRGSLSNLARLPSQSPSLEDLHKGKAFSFSHFVQRVVLSASTSAAGSQFNSQSGSKRSSATSSSGSLADPTANVAGDGDDLPRSASLDPSLLKHYYFHSELQFMAALVAISERLVAVPREARQSSLTAELTLLNHNFPAPVCIPLWCLADTPTGTAAGTRAHHQIVRISPGDAVVLNSADRVPFLLFVEVLDQDDDDDRPLGEAKGTDLAAIKKTQTDAKDLARAVAVVEHSGATSTSSTSETSGTSDHRPSSVPNPSRPIVRRRSSLSLLPTALVIPTPAASADVAAGDPAPTSAPPASATAPPLAAAIRKSPSTPAIRDLSLKTLASAPIVPGFITHAEFEDRMRTAAIMLAQLSLQEQQMPAVNGKASKRASMAGGGGGGAGAASAASAAARLTEEIRSRILKEMMALEERRLHAVKEWHAAQERARVLEEEEQDADEGEGEAWEHVEYHGYHVDDPTGGGLTRNSVSTPSVLITPSSTSPSPVPGAPLSSPPPPPPPESSSGRRPATRRRRQGSMPSSPMSPAGPAAMLELDKDDPSSAVVRETWDRKQARIRASSAFGRHPRWTLYSMIVKSGADLRQEQLACQLVRELARVWAQGTGCWVYPYRVLVTGSGHGIIETVKNTISIHSLKKDAYARIGDHFTLKHFFLNEFGPESSPRYKHAIQCFSESLAGYSIMSYVLNVKDRHNGNILLDYTSGHLVHIDFGFMLSNSPGSVAFESAPFKLAHEYVELLDGLGSTKFREWRNRVVHGFLALRRDHDRLVGLVEIMERNSPLDCFASSSLQSAPAAASGSGSAASSPVPPRSSQAAGGGVAPGNTTPTPSAATQYPVASALRERLLLNLTDVQVAEFVDRLIASSLGNVFTRLYDGFQYYTQGVMA